MHSGQKLVIGVDLGEDVHPRIGIEIFDPGVSNLMEKFYADKKIDEKQYHYLKEWEDIHFLSDDLSEILSSQFKRQINALHTRINHFKFVVDDSEKPTLKGYLYYCF